MKIAVIDGQGGGLGKAIIERLKNMGVDGIKIIALGTNSIATANMIKAGAKDGATGENPIVYNAPRVDIIMGPIGIIVANSMLGELTPKMAEAITESSAEKILIPFNKCSVYVTGVVEDTLQYHVDCGVNRAVAIYRDTYKD